MSMPRRIHVAHAQLVVEMPALRDRDRRVAPEDFLLPVRPRLHAVDAGIRAQHIQPFAREHMRVNIDNRHASILTRETRSRTPVAAPE